jgi:hypothetical protein
MRENPGDRFTVPGCGQRVQPEFREPSVIATERLTPHLSAKYPGARFWSKFPSSGAASLGAIVHTMSAQTSQSLIGLPDHRVELAGSPEVPVIINNSHTPIIYQYQQRQCLRERLHLRPEADDKLERQSAFIASGADQRAVYI